MANGGELEGAVEKNKQDIISQSQSNIVSFKQDFNIDITKRMPQFDNGDSLAYVAFNNKNKASRFMALVADVGQLIRWRSITTYDNLSETSLIRLIEHGVIYWPLSGKQCYVFIYDVSIGDSLDSPDALSKSGWRHPDIINFFVTPMANILKGMHDRGLCHGSIRLNNIFFGAGKKKNTHIVLGDCLSVYPHSSQPSVFLSIEKALAEPFGRGEGTISDDIYAFGVSLAMFLRKNDEIGGLSDIEIVRRKLELGSYTALVGNERFQVSFIELLRGIMHDDPSLRWGIEDIFSWLDGGRITPPGVARRKKANRPFSFKGKKYLFSDSLALDMAYNFSESIKIIESGELSQWIEKAFGDKELSDNYEKAQDKIIAVGGVKENKYFAHTQICLALNPMLPIYYKERVFAYDGLGPLMARTFYDDGDVLIFKEVLQQYILDQAVSLKTIPQIEVLSYIKNFDVCRGMLRQKSYGNGIERCMYLLCHSAPCLSPKFKEFFVFNAKTCLLAFEKLASRGGECAIFMDQHSLAFFFVHEKRLIDRVMYDLNSTDKDKKIVGNLKFLAILQKKSKISSLPAIAKVFSSSLDGVYKLYHNLKLRKQIIDGVEREVKKGNLVAMSALIDNYKLKQRDAKVFQLAKREYKLLQYEYDQYNRKLANRKTYGVVNGQETAALISWIIATIITIISVFAFLSGYRIF